MLLNPYQADLQVVPGTRMLQEHFGLAGYQLVDPNDFSRLWTVTSLYTPVGKQLDGLRIKMVDNKRFVTFCNQRDFEVLIGIAKPGDWCIWAAQEYPGPGDNEWFGFCMDVIDQCDDLHERELMLYAEYSSGNIADWNGVTIERRLQVDPGSDLEDLWIPNSYPKEDTVYGRWLRVQRNRIEWKKVI